MEVTSRVPSTVEAVVEEFQAENVPMLAASIAYNAFVSLLPLLLLLLVVVAAVGNESLTQGVVDLTEGVLAPGMQGQVAESMDNASSRAGASVIGAVTLLWGALKIFRGVDTAFSEIYDSQGKDSFVDQVTDGLLVLACIGLAVLAAVAAGAVFTVYEHLPFVGLLTPLVLVAGLTVAFFPVFYVFPDVELSAREVLPGVVLAAVAWVILESVFQMYVAFADKGEASGVIGGVVLLLTWLYFSSLVLLLGAVVNAVLAGRTGDPEVDAMAGDEGSVEEERAVEDRRAVEDERLPDEAPTAEAPTDEPPTEVGLAETVPSAKADDVPPDVEVVPREEYERVRDRYRHLERHYTDLAKEHGDLKRGSARLESKRVDEPWRRFEVDD